MDGPRNWWNRGINFNRREFGSRRDPGRAGTRAREVSHADAPPVRVGTPDRTTGFNNDNDKDNDKNKDNDNDNTCEEGAHDRFRATRFRTDRLVNRVK